jgi:multidrug efflux pump subunit AcrA (membrane-fusion protein)
MMERVDRLGGLVVRLTLVLMLIGTALGSASCQIRSEPAQAQMLSATATVERDSIDDVIQMAGQVVAKEERHLTFGTVGGRVDKVHVELGQEVEAGMPLVVLDTTELERTLREAEADLEVAETLLLAAQRTAEEAELAQARADLADAEYALALASRDLQAAEEAGLTPYEQEVYAAEVALESAQNRLEMLRIQTNRSEIRRLEYDESFLERTIRDTKPDTTEHAEAVEGLKDVRKKLDQLRRERAEMLKEAEEEVTDKARALERARAKLARVSSGDKDPLAALRLAQEQARATVDELRQHLEDLQAGVDTEAVKAARTAYEAAEAKVKDAQAAIEDATLFAPFDGVIFKLSVRPQQKVQPSDKLVYLVNTSELRIKAQVTEIDVSKLAKGQPVRVSFDGQPNQFYQGQVLSLPPRGSSMGGMNYYEVTVSLEADKEIRPGMLANMHVLIGKKEDVLVIPAAAVQYISPRQSLVTVLGPGGTMEQREVEIGINDGIMAQVVSGLEQGEQVVIPLMAPGQAQGAGSVPKGRPPVKVEE